MSAQTRILVSAVAGVVVGVCLLFVILLLLSIYNFGPMAGRFPVPWQRFESNGERIYFTGRSESGDPIRAEMPGMHRMPQGRMACADCHGPDGKGGPVRMMGGMRGMYEDILAPDIRYKTLTSEEEHSDAHEEHPAYSDETLKRAITEGTNPAGEALDWPMPRWDVSERDLNDLIEFLKTLD